MFRLLSEFVLCALILIGWVGQVVIPILRNTPLLPLFRRETVLRHKLRVTEQEKLEAALEQELREAQRFVGECRKHE